MCVCVCVGACVGVCVYALTLVKMSYRKTVQSLRYLALLILGSTVVGGCGIGRVLFVFISRKSYNSGKAKPRGTLSAG